MVIEPSYNDEQPFYELTPSFYLPLSTIFQMQTNPSWSQHLCLSNDTKFSLNIDVVEQTGENARHIHNGLSFAVDSYELGI